MDHPDRARRRNEVARLAKDAFDAHLEDTAAKRADERDRVIKEITSRGNVGGYVPALTTVAAKRLRRDVLGLANTYVSEFTRFGVPCDAQTEIDLETTAKQMAGGTCAAVRGQFELIETRTRQRLNISADLGHIEREIAAAMSSAVKKGKIMLRRQRIQTKDSKRPSQSQQNAPNGIVEYDPDHEQRVMTASPGQVDPRADISHATLDQGYDMNDPQFRLGAEQHPQFCAHWDEATNQWSLPFNASAEDMFKLACRVAVGRLRRSNHPVLHGVPGLFREPWKVLLDLMRIHERGFIRVRVPEPSPQISFDGAVPLTPWVLPQRPGGDIFRLFQVSADFWDEIFDPGFGSETTKRAEPGKPMDESRQTPEPAPERSINDDRSPYPSRSEISDPVSIESGKGNSTFKTNRSNRKGDLTLLQKADRSVYQSVDFPTAEEYADIRPRRRQQLIIEGVLKVVGKGKHRRITVESLVGYCPPVDYAQ